MKSKFAYYHPHSLPRVRRSKHQPPRCHRYPRRAARALRSASRPSSSSTSGRPRIHVGGQRPWGWVALPRASWGLRAVESKGMGSDLRAQRVPNMSARRLTATAPRAHPPLLFLSLTFLSLTPLLLTVLLNRKVTLLIRVLLLREPSDRLARARAGARAGRARGCGLRVLTGDCGLGDFRFGGRLRGGGGGGRGGSGKVALNVLERFLVLRANGRVSDACFQCVRRQLCCLASSCAHLELAETRPAS